MMAKKQFGKELRRSSNNIKKKPLDISSAENLNPKPAPKAKPIKKEEQAPKVEVKKEKPVVVSTASTKKMQRTSINFPFDVYDALREHAFKNRTSMRDYLVDLIKKDLKL